MTDGRSNPGKKRFRLRVFVSFGLFWSFLVVAVSGIVMYFRPEGSLAAWADWSFLGLDKKGWEGIHTLTIVSVLIFSALHIILNWKALWGYLRRKASAFAGAKIEFAAALLLVVALTAGAIGRWAPLWKLMDARAAIKQGALAVVVLPPAADAAERSLTDLCATIPIGVAQAIDRLSRAGYPVEDPSRTLAEISKTFGTSPERLYRLLTGN